MQCILDTQSNSSSKSSKTYTIWCVHDALPRWTPSTTRPSPAPQLELALGMRSIPSPGRPNPNGVVRARRRTAAPPKPPPSRHLQDHRQSNDPTSRQSRACRWAALLQRDPRQLLARAAEQCYGCLSVLGEIARRHSPQVQPPVQVASAGGDMSFPPSLATRSTVQQQDPSRRGSFSSTDDDGASFYCLEYDAGMVPLSRGLKYPVHPPFIHSRLQESHQQHLRATP